MPKPAERWPAAAERGRHWPGLGARRRASGPVWGGCHLRCANCVVEPQRQERAEQQEACRESRKECVGFGKNDLHQPSGGSEARAVKEAGKASLAKIVPAGTQPADDGAGFYSADYREAAGRAFGAWRFIVAHRRATFSFTGFSLPLPLDFHRAAFADSRVGGRMESSTLAAQDTALPAHAPGMAVAPHRAAHDSWPFWTSSIIAMLSDRGTLAPTDGLTPDRSRLQFRRLALDLRCAHGCFSRLADSPFFWGGRPRQVVFMQRGKKWMVFCCCWGELGVGGLVLCVVAGVVRLAGNYYLGGFLPWRPCRRASRQSSSAASCCWCWRAEPIACSV